MLEKLSSWPKQLRASLRKVDTNPGDQTSREKHDMVKAAAFVLLIYLFAWKFDIAEKLALLTAEYESMQLDELPIAILMAALAGIWFSRRRMQEIKLEAGLRAEAELSLAKLLKENRALAAHAREAQELERRRMAQDIHDDMGQYLTAIRLDARSLSKLEYPVVANRAERIGLHAEHVQKAIKNLLHRLRPVALDEYGLTDAIRHLVKEWRKQHPEISCRCSLDGNCVDLPDIINVTAYRIVQEALTNISRHADATTVLVHIGFSPEDHDMLQVKVHDNGKGFNPSGHNHNGFGLVAMRERVTAAGGLFLMQTEPDSGVRILAAFPLSNTTEQAGA
ncbi:MAG: two-component sensor histidine kinase [Betaproteobacteria bacterium HGW-Betaproteobacteria-8]|nr:MAG: two-component sensor histidine kinase [Betaproteobacteria bacterium HGW-Betaproteobacteria-8]